MEPSPFLAIAPDVTLGKDVRLSKFINLYGCTIGDETKIGACVEIQKGAGGAWAPAVLLLVVAALIWSRLAPGPCNCLGFVTVPNFWWQLGEVGLIAALTLFCGWLQGVLGWTPREISLEPPAHAAVHEHH